MATWWKKAGFSDAKRGARAGEHGLHSPFALALFDALAKGDADLVPKGQGDGVITTTELYLYLREQVEVRAEAQANHEQTPGLWPLNKHRKGEFIFLHPRHRLNLPPRPNRSPYKGLASFDESDQALFYGRDRVIAELRARAEHNRLLVVSGASGTGKSSVVKAGLLPVLRKACYRILPVSPKLDMVLGEGCVPTLGDHVEPPDLVILFRASPQIPAHAEEILALPRRPPGVWLQLGIRHPEASARLVAAGIRVVEDACSMVEHARLLHGRT